MLECPKCGAWEFFGGDFDILAVSDDGTFTLECQECGHLFTSRDEDLLRVWTRIWEKFYSELSREDKVTVI